VPGHSLIRLEEEGGYEYATYQHGGESGQEEHHIESGVLYQPLGAEAASEATTQFGSATPLCEAVAEGPCARSVPDDHSPDVESECNKTGQDCGRRRSRPSHNEGLKNACTVAGVLISLAGFPESVPANVAKVISGGGAAAAAACRQL
jgi:hypothetical protein